jgi:hypothetical protein
MSNLEFAKEMISYHSDAILHTEGISTSPGWGVEIAILHSFDENDGAGVKEKLEFFPYYSEDENDPWEEAQEFINSICC